MNYRLGFFILAIVLGGLVSYMIFKPSEVDNPYLEGQIKQSQLREDSLILEINKLNTLKNELKKNMVNIDSSYIDITKDSLRSRIRYNMLANPNR